MKYVLAYNLEVRLTREKDDELVRGKKYSYTFSRRVAGYHPTPIDLKFIDKLVHSSAVVAPTHPNKSKWL